MDHAINTIEILPLTDDSTTGSVDFTIPDWANGVIVFIKTADRKSSASFTFSLTQLAPDGAAVVTSITSAAVVSETTTHLTVAPGITAVTNQHANDVLRGPVRLSWTAGAGTYDLRAWASFVPA